MVRKIAKADIDEDIKLFLTAAAARHSKFNYDVIADFYAHSDKEIQSLMEDSALVIIDFDKAIEQGYVKLSESVREMYSEDHE